MFIEAWGIKGLIVSARDGSAVYDPTSCLLPKSGRSSGILSKIKPHFPQQILMPLPSSCGGRVSLHIGHCSDTSVLLGVVSAKAKAQAIFQSGSSILLRLSSGS